MEQKLNTVVLIKRLIEIVKYKSEREMEKEISNIWWCNFEFGGINDININTNGYEIICCVFYDTLEGDRLPLNIIIEVSLEEISHGG